MSDQQCHRHENPSLPSTPNRLHTALTHEAHRKGEHKDDQEFQAFLCIVKWGKLKQGPLAPLPGLTNEIQKEYFQFCEKSRIKAGANCWESPEPLRLRAMCSQELNSRSCSSPQETAPIQDLLKNKCALLPRMVRKKRGPYFVLSAFPFKPTPVPAHLLDIF